MISRWLQSLQTSRIHSHFIKRGPCLHATHFNYRRKLFLTIRKLPLKITQCSYFLICCLGNTVVIDISAFLPTVKWVKSLNRVQLFATPWTVACQAPPSMEFSRQEYWTGLPFPSPGDLPDPGIKPGSPTLQADALPSEPPGKSHLYYKKCFLFPFELYFIWLISL